MRRIISVCLLTAVGVATIGALTGCGSTKQASTTTTTTAKNGTVYTNAGPIALTKGQKATIKLAGNNTTGFQWVVSAPTDPAVAKVVSNQYEPDANPQGMAGAGGAQVLVVEGVGPGTTTLTLEYKRPWEQDTPPAKTESFPITVS